MVINISDIAASTIILGIEWVVDGQSLIEHILSIAQQQHRKANRIQNISRYFPIGGSDDDVSIGEEYYRFISRLSFKCRCPKLSPLLCLEGKGHNVWTEFHLNW